MRETRCPRGEFARPVRGGPAAVEVFAGNAGDPSTVASRVDKVRSRFGIGRVALVGDRGMLTTARIREDLEPAGLDWISALKTSDIRKLLREGADGAAAARRKPGLEAAVEDCKGLARVERAFLTMKASRLRVRPVHVCSEDHVRTHVFLCMLACHVEWHMRRRLAPILTRRRFRPDPTTAFRCSRSRRSCRAGPLTCWRSIPPSSS